MKGAKLLQKIITGACIVGIIAFLGQAALSPFYSIGIGRIISPIIFIGYAAVFWAFMRRQAWSWIFTFVLGLVMPVASIFFFPVEKSYYGELTGAVRFLVLSQALASLVILFLMFIPATKHWFRDQRIDPNFHRGEQLDVSYQNRFWDLLWFNLYQLPRAPTFYIVTGLLLLSTALLVFDLLSASEHSLFIKVLVYIVILVPLLCGMAIISLIVIGLIRIYHKIQYQRTKQNSRVSISESGVMCESLSDIRQIKWSGIAKVRQSGNYILLYLSDIMAFVIPKSAFRENSEADRFLSQSLEYWQNARKTLISK